MWPFKTKTLTKARRTPMVKNYQAARINRLTSGWTTEAKHPDQIVMETLPILRARSREQFANNDYMSRFVGLVKSNVVGPKGVTLQAVTKDNKGLLDKSDNDALERSFLDWGRKGNCDVTGQLSFVDIQRLFIGTVIVDGEFLARESRTGPYGYELALIDPESLSINHNVEKLANGNKIKFSIEFDSTSRPVAYYLRDDALTASAYTYGGKKYSRIPAEEIIHCFMPERIGQRRGIPAAATAMMRMNMLQGYEDAAITAARVGASKMGFFTSPAGDGYMGDDEDADGSMITDVEPGVFEQLPEGVDFTAFNPDYPHQQFPEFVKSCLRGIASGLGVSYNSLSNDLEGVNYSSIRAGVLEDREAWKSIQEWMVESFLRRVYLNWLGRALNIGMIKGPKGAALPRTQQAKFEAHVWQPRRWAWVDPMKDTQANIIAIDAGLKSRSSVIREMGGVPEDVWAELEMEDERLGDLLKTPEMEAAEAKPDDE